MPQFCDDQDSSAACGAQHTAQIVGGCPSLAHNHKQLQRFVLSRIIQRKLRSQESLEEHKT